MARRRTVELLPEIFQTETNRQFLAATLDQLTQEPQLKRTQGYVGRRVGPGVDPADRYVVESTATRTDYQLEPGVVFFKPDTNTAVDAMTYPGMIDALDLQGADTTRQDNLWESQYYTWDPFIDLDKFVNYSQYYWVPQGPDSVDISTTLVALTDEWEITRTSTAAAHNYQFSDVAGTNPIITLVRGGNYKFNVNQPGAGFWIQTDPGVNGRIPATPNISSRDVLGVTNNGEDGGTVTFNVPLKTAQDFYYSLNDIGTVDLIAGNIKFSEINNVYVETFLAANPNGVDGIVNLDNRTIVFTNTIENAQDGGWQINSQFDPLTRTAPPEVSEMVSYDVTGQNYDILPYNTETEIIVSGSPDPLDGQPGSYDVGLFDQTTDIESPAVRYSIWQIQYIYDASNRPFMRLTQVTEVPDLSRFRITFGAKWSSTNWYKNAEGYFQEMPLLTAVLDTLWYQDGSDPEIFGQIKLIDPAQNEPLDLNDIIGAKNYTSPNGVVFTNGLKVQLRGIVNPPELQDLEFYVEGVGTGLGIDARVGFIDGEAYFGPSHIFQGQRLTGAVHNEDVFQQYIYETYEDSIANYGAGYPVGAPLPVTPIVGAELGNGIQLIPVTEFVTPETYTKSATVPYDSTGYDAAPYDANENAPEVADYIIINRAARDRNAWSRSNRWFHVDVLNATAAYNNQVAVLDNDRRAKRPIIEFRPGLELFNFGTQGKQPVDIIDFKETDAFSNINGTTGYGIDGYNFLDGTTVIFAADVDPQVRNRVYRVRFIDPDNSPATRTIIDLVPVIDGQAQVNQTVVCLNGLTLQGKSFWFNGAAWLPAQEKVSVNQAPLFDVRDANGVSYSNRAVYPSSTFEGSKLFGYALGGTARTDDILGFALKYLNINNIGDIVFENYLYTDTFIYVRDNVSSEVNISEGFVREYFDRVGFSNLIGWQTSVEENRSRQVFRFTYDGTDLILDVPVDTTSVFPAMQVYVQGQYVDPTNYTFSITDYGSTLLTLDANTIDIGAVIEVQALSNVKSRVAYYEVPLNLENNPLNQNSDAFTLGTIRNHYNSIGENLKNIVGPINGANNTRDLGDILRYGDLIVQNSAPATLAGVFLREKQYELFNSLRFNSQEYEKYKAILLDIVSKGDFINLTPTQILDQAIVEISAGKTNISPFYWSDMIPAGETYTEVTYTYTPISTPVFDLNTVYDFTSSNYQGLLIYLNGTLLQKGYDYEVGVNSPTVTVTSPLAVGDKIVIREYSTTYGSFVPNTPTKLGLYPAFRPEIFLDTNTVNPTLVIQGHDGSITRSFGDFRDQVLLEFETRIFDNLKIATPVPLTATEVVPGQFRTTDYTLTEINEILSTDFLSWVGWNKLDYTAQNYLANDPFTYNYSQSGDKLTGQPLLGAWRGIYNYFYDTTDPDTRPWEMLGFGEEPDWWQAEYGPAPYTSGNWVLWQDLAAGLVKDPTGSYVLPQYARPGLITNVVTTINVISGGTGYTAENTTIFASPDPEGEFAQPMVLGNPVISTNGSIVSIPIVSPGRGYIVAPTITVKSTTGTGATITSEISTVPLTIPVDSEGQLLSPLDSVVGNYDATSFRRSWTFGDGGPVENAWRTSSSYPFAVMRLLALTKPAKFFSLFADRDRYVFDPGVGQYLWDGRYRLEAKNLDPLYGNGVSKASYIDWIIDYNRQLGKNSTTDLTDTLKNIGVNLCWRVGAFTDKKYLKISAERSTPNSLNTSLQLPDESYQLLLYKDQPFERIVYSSVIIQKVSNGYAVLGYSSTRPYFEIQVSRTSGILEFIEVGSLRVRVPVQYANNIVRVPYGYVFTNETAVCDFLLSYGEFLKRQGLVFETRENGYILDWMQMAQEFLYWSQQGWSDGSLINLNPSATRISVTRPQAVVDSIATPSPDNLVLNQNRQAINPANLVIERLDNTFRATSLTNETINFIDLKFIAYEHIVILDNVSIFADLIYDPVTAARQSRVLVAGWISADWTGQVDAPGFVLNQNNIAEWIPNRKYTKGEIVLFKNEYWSALTIIQPSEQFDYTLWIKSDYDEIQKGLLPNSANASDQLATAYSVYNANLENDVNLFSYGLIGFRPREYMKALDLDDVSQVGLYQQFLGSKGTTRSTEIFTYADLGKETAQYDIYEYWAMLKSQYGATANRSYFELLLDEAKLKSDPALIQVIQPGQTSEADETVLVQDIWKSSYKITSPNILPTTDIPVTDVGLPTAGYVKLDDADITVFDLDNPQAIVDNLDSIGVGTTIWVAKINNYDWNIYRAQVVPGKIQQVSDNLNGRALVEFNAQHGLVPGNFLIIKFFDDSINGVYRVLSVPSLYNVIISYTFTGNQTAITGNGVGFTLVSARIAQPADVVNLSYAKSLLPGAKVWVNNTGNDRWAVLEKTDPFTEVASLLPDQGTSQQRFGSSIAQGFRNLSALIGAPGYQTSVQYVSDGSSTDFSYSAFVLPITISSYVKVYVNDVLQTEITDYTVDLVNKEINFLSAPAESAIVTLTYDNGGALYPYVKESNERYVQDNVPLQLNAPDAKELGSTVDIGAQTWAISGAPSSNNNKGYALTIYKGVTSDTFQQRQLLVTPDGDFAAAEFGYSAAMSQDEHWLYIGAPGINKVYAYGLEEIQQQQVTYTTTQGLFTYSYAGYIDSAIEATQISVVLDNRPLIYGTDFTVNNLNQTIVLSQLPLPNKLLVISRRAQYQLDVNNYTYTDPSPPGGTAAVFSVNVTRGLRTPGIINPGTGYQVGDTITIPSASIGGGSSDLVITVAQTSARYSTFANGDTNFITVQNYEGLEVGQEVFFLNGTGTILSGTTIGAKVPGDFGYDDPRVFKLEPPVGDPYAIPGDPGLIYSIEFCVGPGPILDITYTGGDAGVVSDPAIFDIGSYLATVTDLFSFTVTVNGSFYRPGIDYDYDSSSQTIEFINHDPVIFPGLGATILVNTNTYWDYVDVLTIPGLAANARFGHSVATSTDGRQVIIGTARQDVIVDGETLTEAGSSYVFDRSVQRFQITDPAQSSYSTVQTPQGPQWVSLNGEFLINGDQFLEGQFTAAGNTVTLNSSVELTLGDTLEIDTNSFNLIQALISQEPNKDAQFGYTVDLCVNNCSLYVGSPFNDLTAPGAGIVEFYINQARVYGSITSSVANPTLTPGEYIRVDDVFVELQAPAAWTSTQEWVTGTIVNNSGELYVAKIPVPVGVAISNTVYWKPTVWTQVLVNDINTAITQGLLPNVIVDLSADLTFLADGSTTAFNIGSLYSAADSYNPVVLVDDVLQVLGSSYTYNNTTEEITFTTAPERGSIVTVVGGFVNFVVKNSAAVPVRNKVQVLPGTGTLFTDIGINAFVPQQVIESPVVQDNSNFGKTIFIDTTTSFLVVGAPNGNTIAPMTFDGGTTYFDARSTTFADPILESGAVYIYDFLPATNPSASNPGQFVFGQQIYDLGIKSLDQFGSALDFTTGTLLIGSFGNDATSLDIGRAAQYLNATLQPAWRALRRQTPVVDINLLNTVFMYDRVSGAPKQYFDYFDPLQGRVLGAVRQNLDYIGAVDPAAYNVGDVNNYGVHWAQERVGQIWWNTSDVRFIDPNQDDIVYASRRWGQVFPGSTINVYQWVSSSVPPVEYTGPGAPLNTFSYSVTSGVNEQGLFITTYYFWVTGINTVDKTARKTLSIDTIARYIEAPRSSGISYIAPINSSTIAIYNALEYITAEDTIIHVEFDQQFNEAAVHVEYQLIPQDRADGILTGGLYQKMLDSFTGSDPAGNPVPDPFLSPSEKYGVAFRPRQSFFRNRFLALQNYLQRANTVMAQYPITESRSFNLLNSEEPEPSAASGAWNKRLANYEELTYQDLIQVPVGYKYLVASDATNNGLWTIYEVGGSNLTGERTLNLIRVQNYDTKLYWKRINWYLPGYNPLTRPVAEVPNFSALDTISVPEGSTVKVTANAQGKFEIYQLVNGVWVRVALQDGTIQIDAGIWDYSIGRFGFDIEVFDAQYFDKEPIIETRKIIEAINQELFIGDLAIERNRLLVLTFNYILSEQEAPTWLTKTSLIDVDHTIRELVPFQIYRQDNQDFVLNYIQEVKPYHVQIREFNLRYQGFDVYQGTATDFDVPAFWDPTQNLFISPVLDDTGTLSTTSSFASTAAIWQQLPWNQWYQNYLLSIDSVSIVDGGQGYTVPPEVVFGVQWQELTTYNTGDQIAYDGNLYTVIQGGTTGQIAPTFTSGSQDNGTTILAYAGVQATGLARVNSAGQVVTVEVINAGEGYMITVPVFLIGGNGTGARAVAVMGNNLVRDIKTTIKYDRYEYQTSIVDWQANVIYTQGTQVRFADRVWSANATGSSTEFDPQEWTVVPAGSLSGVNRTMGYYVPAVNEPGLDLALLISGVDYPGVQVYGLNFDQNTGFDVGNYDINPYDNLSYGPEGRPTYDPAILDAIYESRFLDPYLGVSTATGAPLPDPRLSAIDVDGGAFVDTYESHAPEELVPGIMYDTLDFRVTTTPGSDWAGDGHGFQLGSVSHEFTLAGTTYSFEDTVTFPVVIKVWNRTAGIELTPEIDFTTDWVNKTVTIISGMSIGQVLLITAYELGGGHQMYRNSYIGADIGASVIIPVPTDLISSMVVFINGEFSLTYSYRPEYAATGVQTNYVANNGTTLTVTSTQGILVGDWVTGSGIESQNITVTGIVDSSTLTISSALLPGTYSGVLTFKANLGNTELTFTPPLSDNQYAFVAAFTDSQYSWSTPVTQYFVSAGEFQYTLTERLGGTNIPNVIVEKNGIRARPSEGIEYFADGSTSEYYLPTRGGYSQALIADNDVAVYIDGRQLSLGADYVVSPWDGSSDRYITLNIPTAPGQQILISVRTAAQYYIVGDTLIWKTTGGFIPLPGDIISVTTWNDTQQQDIITEVFVGPSTSGVQVSEGFDDTDFDPLFITSLTQLSTISVAGDFVSGRPYRIKVLGTTDFTAIGASSNTVGLVFTATGPGTGTGDAYDMEYVRSPSTSALNGDPGAFDYAEGIITQTNRFNTGRLITNSSRVMVSLNGFWLFEDQDFTVDGTDVVLAGPIINNNDVVAITIFTMSVLPGGQGFRIFQDMREQQSSYRITVDSSTTTTAAVSATDDIIFVVDSSKLGEPNLEEGIFGLVTIDGERIAYRFKDTARQSFTANGIDNTFVLSGASYNHIDQGTVTVVTTLDSIVLDLPYVIDESDGYIAVIFTVAPTVGTEITVSFTVADAIYGLRRGTAGTAIDSHLVNAEVLGIGLENYLPTEYQDTYTIQNFLGDGSATTFVADELQITTFDIPWSNSEIYLMGTVVTDNNKYYKARIAVPASQGSYTGNNTRTDFPVLTVTSGFDQSLIPDSSIAVYVDSEIKTLGTDYTLTAGPGLRFVVFNTAPDLGAVVDIVVIINTGNTTYWIPMDSSVEVFVGGIKQTQGYTITADNPITVEFDTAPASGYQVSCVIRKGLSWYQPDFITGTASDGVALQDTQTYAARFIARSA